jgi:hypothetical protein
MSAETRSYTLDVSDYLFMLTTECIRRHSNNTKRYQTLASLVNEFAPAGVPLEHYSADDLREHLRLVPTKGAERIYLTVSTKSADSLIELKRALVERLETSLTVADALSVLLFAFLAESTVAKVVGKFAGDEPSDMSDERSRSGRDGPNARPIK